MTIRSTHPCKMSYKCIRGVYNLGLMYRWCLQILPKFDKPLYCSYFIQYVCFNSSGAEIPIRHFVCLGRIFNCSAIIEIIVRINCTPLNQSASSNLVMPKISDLITKGLVHMEISGRWFPVYFSYEIICTQFIFAHAVCERMRKNQITSECCFSTIVYNAQYFCFSPKMIPELLLWILWCHGLFQCFHCIPCIFQVVHNFKPFDVKIVAEKIVVEKYNGDVTKSITKSFISVYFWRKPFDHCIVTKSLYTSKIVGNV